jgi:hypothetical protein
MDYQQPEPSLGSTDDEHPASDDLPELDSAILPPPEAEEDDPACDFVWLEGQAVEELVRSDEPVGLASLPGDIVSFLCVGYLSGRDVARLLQVNRSLAARLQHRRQLWHRMVQRDFPFVLAGERSRKSRLEKLAKQGPPFSLKTRQEDVADWRDAYGLASKYVKRRNVACSPIVCCGVVVYNFKTFSVEVLDVLDIMRIPGMPEICCKKGHAQAVLIEWVPVAVPGELFVLTSMCRWSYGIGDVWRYMPLNKEGSPAPIIVERAFNRIQHLKFGPRFSAHCSSQLRAKPVGSLNPWSIPPMTAKRAWVHLRVFASPLALKNSYPYCETTSGLAVAPAIEVVMRFDP